MSDRWSSDENADEMDIKLNARYNDIAMIVVQVPRERESVRLQETDVSKRTVLATVCRQCVRNLLHLCTKQVKETGNYDDATRCTN